MARILLGWELGANRGHLVRLAEIARALVAQGHDVHAALQNVYGAAAIFPPGVQIWQAPVWPRLIVNVARLEGPPVATMGDILVRLGLDRGEALEGLVTAWDSLFRAIRPDAVVSDFAPVLLRAAWGRIPSIAVGTGFERVPGNLAHFPSLNGAPAVHDEAETLARVNDTLVRLGRPAMAGLPALFAADVSLAGTFREIDVYRDSRAEPPISPTIGAAVPPVSDGAGEEVFVYGFERIMADAALWDGLARSGLRIRVHIPRVSQALQQRFAALGFAFEPHPLPFARIAERSRLVVSHGGHGFVCSALLAGVPHVVTPYDLEKQIHADRVTALGLGGQVKLQAIKAAPFAESLRAIHADPGFGSRARAAAPGFHAQMGRPMARAVLEALDVLGIPPAPHPDEFSPPSVAATD